MLLTADSGVPRVSARSPQTGEVQKAANAVFTVLLQQPNNEIMRENFKYYTTMEGVDTGSIVSLEPQVSLQPQVPPSLRVFSPVSVHQASPQTTRTPIGACPL